MQQYYQSDRESIIIAAKALLKERCADEIDAKSSLIYIEGQQSVSIDPSGQHLVIQMSHSEYPDVENGAIQTAEFDSRIQQHARGILVALGASIGDITEETPRNDEGQHTGIVGDEIGKPHQRYESRVIMQVPLDKLNKELVDDIAQQVDAVEEIELQDASYPKQSGQRLLHLTLSEDTEKVGERYAQWQHILAEQNKEYLLPLRTFEERNDKHVSLDLRDYPAEDILLLSDALKEVKKREVLRSHIENDERLGLGAEEVPANLHHLLSGLGCSLSPLSEDPPAITRPFNQRCYGIQLAEPITQEQLTSIEKKLNILANHTEDALEDKQYIVVLRPEQLSSPEIGKSNMADAPAYGKKNWLQKIMKNTSSAQEFQPPAGIANIEFSIMEFRKGSDIYRNNHEMRYIMGEDMGKLVAGMAAIDTTNLTRSEPLGHSYGGRSA